jgi:hypothetical protein
MSLIGRGVRPRLFFAYRPKKVREKSGTFADNQAGISWG